MEYKEFLLNKKMEEIAEKVGKKYVVIDCRKKPYTVRGEPEFKVYLRLFPGDVYITEKDVRLYGEELFVKVLEKAEVVYESFSEYYDDSQKAMALLLKEGVIIESDFDGKMIEKIKSLRVQK